MLVVLRSRGDCLGTSFGSSLFVRTYQRVVLCATHRASDFHRSHRSAERRRNA
jgi:hypothetical protein